MSIVKQINRQVQRDIHPLVDGERNLTCVVLEWIIQQYLDSTRTALNIGAFTGRDLDWMLPICEPISKPIECVENWYKTPSRSLTQRLEQEIEKLYSHPLVTWTWTDAIEAESWRSSDFFFSTPNINSLDIFQPMRDLNHSAVWMLPAIHYALAPISRLIASGRIWHLASLNDCHLFTNDETIYNRWIEDCTLLNKQVKHQRLERCGETVRWRSLTQPNFNQWFEKIRANS